MENLEKILETLRKHRDEIIQRFGVVRMGIYGSFVRGEESEKSDIDIYVEFDLDKLTFEKYLELIEYLENLIGRKVEIITRDGVETIRIPYIKKEIKENIVYV